MYFTGNHERKSRALGGLVVVLIFSVVAKLRKFYRLMADMNASRDCLLVVIFSSDELCLRLRFVYAFKVFSFAVGKQKEQGLICWLVVVFFPVFVRFC